MTAELEPDSAWVVGDTGFPKQGEGSVGVERQYSGTLGKTGNCQVAVSLHHVGEQGNAVLGWRLYLPETWAKDQDRRQAAGVPEEVVFKKKWELALDLIDQVRDWGLPDRLVLADAGYGEATEFREGLEERDLRYAVGIAPQVGVWTKAPKIKVPEYSGRSAPPKKWDYGNPPTGSSTGMRRTRKSGCWWSGPSRRRNQPNTSSAICQRATHRADWRASPNAGGRSNKTTTNSRKNSAWIIMKEEAGMVGTIM